MSSALATVGFAISPDGSGAVVPMPALEEGADRRIVVVQNWFTEFEEGGR